MLKSLSIHTGTTSVPKVQVSATLKSAAYWRKKVHAYKIPRTRTCAWMYTRKATCTQVYTYVHQYLYIDLYAEVQIPASVPDQRKLSHPTSKAKGKMHAMLKPLSIHSAPRQYVIYRYSQLKNCSSVMQRHTCTKPVTNSKQVQIPAKLKKCHPTLAQIKNSLLKTTNSDIQAKIRYLYLHRKQTGTTTWKMTEMLS